MVHRMQARWPDCVRPELTYVLYCTVLYKITSESQARLLTLVSSEGKQTTCGKGWSARGKVVLGAPDFCGELGQPQSPPEIPLPKPPRYPVLLSPSDLGYALSWPKQCSPGVSDARLWDHLTSFLCKVCAWPPVLPSSHAKTNSVTSLLFAGSRPT